MFITFKGVKKRMEREIKELSLNPAARHEAAYAAKELNAAKVTYNALPLKEKEKLEQFADFTYYPPLYGKQS
jgi:hypothetical protein